jgi:ComF family protein
MRPWRSGTVHHDAIQVMAEFAIDLVYPKRCAGCGKRGSWLCQRCDEKLDRFSPPWCARCGLPRSRQPCDCPSLPASLRRARSVGPYAEWLRGAIIQFKYHGEWARADPLGQALAVVAADLMPCDGLVPVPLHASRIRQRGFNQSLLLANCVGEMLSVPVLDILSRVRRTRAQVHLAAAQRAENVRDAFALTSAHPVQGTSLILIDDVITTGATLTSCASALLREGASSVSVATVARDR